MMKNREGKIWAEEIASMYPEGQLDVSKSPFSKFMRPQRVKAIQSLDINLRLWLCHYAKILSDKLQRSSSLNS